MVGTSLAQYEILEKIGESGMGEVYRARDTRLGREVAIKVLPKSFAQDAERLARFEREAKLLAALNHANIATLYGFEEEDGTRFLAMELVEGETLAERIARGGIPIDEALSWLRQIASALEAAHDKGIIHRDLKPANIKITPEGQIKVLDFGLAKAFNGDDGVDAVSSMSPTLTKGTALGAILGTAAYMSPEQAKGKAVDPRATAVIFRSHNAVHMGDVYNNSGYPFIDAGNGGSLDGIIEFCKAVLAELDEDTVVIPGHGPVATYADMQAYVAMLETIRARIVALIDRGASLSDVIAAKPTAEWDEAKGDPERLLDRAYRSLTRD